MSQHPHFHSQPAAQALVARVGWALALASGLLLTPWAQAQQVSEGVQADADTLDVEAEPNQQDDLEAVSIEPHLPGFREGMRLVFKARSYYLNRNRDTKQDNLGWALGGALEFKTGWLNERLQLAAVMYTSQVAYGPEDKDGTLLFLPGPEQFTVLGEAYATVRLGEGAGLRLGRQSFDLPWLARHDIRMAPNTFEAVAIGRQADKGFSYIAGYVDSIKRKNDDEFISMSEAAGAIGSDEGLALLGAQHVFADGSLVGATNQTAFDVMNTFFIKGEKSFPLADDLSVRAFAQYTDQRSIGDDLIGSFSTHLVAVKGELFFPNGSFRLAASQAGSGKGLQSPFGGPPNYLSIIVDNFDRAGEESYLIGYSYDFSERGLPGLSAMANIADGNTPDFGPNASPDETEYDLTVDYRVPKDRALGGLWVRVRGAWIDQDERVAGGDDFFDFRVIINYPFDFL